MSVLVCVTGQKSCERLIVAGSRIASENKETLAVLHVVRSGDSVLGYTNEPEALEYLLRVSAEHGADMYYRRSDNVIDAIAAEAKSRGARVIVAGRARDYKGWDLLDELKTRLPGVTFEIFGA